MVSSRTDLSVLHIGPGKYRPHDRGHVTYSIWRELASGFRSYRVIGRSETVPADWSDGNLRITLLPSRTEREAEFLLGQFRSVPIGVRSEPDVIVCQSPPLGGLAAIAIARRTGAKVLMELHGAEFFAPARLGSRLWFLQHLTRFALKRADRIRVLSERMRHRLLDVYGTALAGRTSVLPPRVDLSRFRDKATPDGNRTLRLAVVGAVNENKGQLRLIDALHSAPFPIDLHVAGDGPDLEACRRRSAALAQSNSHLQVRCEGRLPHDGIADLLRSCDLLVIYSRSEATPRAALEAMAVGIPVVTTDAGFCADIVGHEAEGFVLGDDPDAEIIGVLGRFNSDRSLLRRMGAAARARAVRDFDSVRLFDEYRRLICETARS
jgi:glycosyltransferase involved in cell wall biosynthesis